MEKVRLILFIVWLVAGTVGTWYLHYINPQENMSLFHKQVVAARPLEAGQPIHETDVTTARFIARNDVFTNTSDLIGTFPLMKIEQGQPLTHAQIERYQVVTKHELETDQLIAEDDIDLARTLYRDGAYTSLEEVVGRRTQQPITKSITLVSSLIGDTCVSAARDLDSSSGSISENDVKLGLCPEANQDAFGNTSDVVGLRLRASTPVTKETVILQSMVKRKYVAPKAGVAIDPGTIITNVDQFATIWAPYDLYEGVSFTKPDHLLNQLVLTRLDDSQTPISRYFLQPCYAITSEHLPAYHSLSNTDLSLNAECQPVHDTLIEQIIGPWVNGVTNQTLDKGTRIEIHHVLDANVMSDKVLVSFDVPESQLFNGQLEAEQEISVWLVPGEAKLGQLPKEFGNVVLLSIREIESGQAVSAPETSEEQLEPTLVSVVVAISKDEEALFLKYLATSQPFLTLEP